MSSLACRGAGSPRHSPSSLAFSPRGNLRGVEKGTGSVLTPRARGGGGKPLAPGVGTRQTCRLLPACLAKFTLPPAPSPLLGRAAPTVLSNSAQSCFPTFWGLKVQVGLSWFSSWPAGTGRQRAEEGGLPERRPLSPSSPLSSPRDVPCRQDTRCSEDTLGLTHPRAGPGSPFRRCY